MKTLIALAAASFITTAAMAEGVPSPEGEYYVFETNFEDQTFQCNVHFVSYTEGANTGLMMHSCGEADQSGSWEAEGGSDSTISIELQSIIPTVIFNDCQQWQSVEVGETASDPCWISSRSGEQIQVRRER